MEGSNKEFYGKKTVDIETVTNGVTSKLEVISGGVTSTLTAITLVNVTAAVTAIENLHRREFRDIRKFIADNLDVVESLNELISSIPEGLESRAAEINDFICRFFINMDSYFIYIKEIIEYLINTFFI